MENHQFFCTIHNTNFVNDCPHCEATIEKKQRSGRLPSELLIVDGETNLLIEKDGQTFRRPADAFEIKICKYRDASRKQGKFVPPFTE